MIKEHSFVTAFQVYIPENLGFIDNVSVHVQIGNEKNMDITTVWHYRYISIKGIEWSKVFRDNGEEVTQCYTTLESIAFSFPIEIWDFIEGNFYLTFVASKDGFLSSYHTEKHYFKKTDKLFRTRQFNKKGF